METKKYNRVMLGKGGKYAKMCRKDGYIGSEFELMKDLSDSLCENWRDFNKKFIPQWLALNPGKTNTAAGLVCGFTWTIIKGLRQGDVVLCPSGEGFYYVGTIISDYYFVPNTELPHRRKVRWMDKVVQRKDMSPALRNSTGSIGTCCNITQYAEEIETLISTQAITPAKTTVTTTTAKKYLERDLHPIFCTYLREKEEVFAKTIYHEKSSSSDKAQKWIHPDIIGVRLSNLSDETKALQKAIDAYKSISLFSFELKREINTDYELKEYFFQALSNSSWANKGYLVAYDINEELRPEIERLNNAFGIGVIRLQAHSTDSEILFEATEKDIDYTTLDKLCKSNPDVRTFIEKINLLLNASKNYVPGALSELQKVCDKVFESDDEIDTYCKEKNIPLL